MRREQMLEMPWGEMWLDRYKTGDRLWMLQTVFSDVPVCIDEAYAIAIREGHNDYMARLGATTANSGRNANISAPN
jgi:hypothetical protein